jgi:hypothetical protein
MGERVDGLRVEDLSAFGARVEDSRPQRSRKTAKQARRREAMAVREIRQ